VNTGAARIEAGIAVAEGAEKGEVAAVAEKAGGEVGVLRINRTIRICNSAFRGYHE